MNKSHATGRQGDERPTSNQMKELRYQVSRGQITKHSLQKFLMNHGSSILSDTRISGSSFQSHVEFWEKQFPGHGKNIVVTLEPLYAALQHKLVLRPPHPELERICRNSITWNEGNFGPLWVVTPQVAEQSIEELRPLDDVKGLKGLFIDLARGHWCDLWPEVFPDSAACGRLALQGKASELTDKLAWVRTLKAGLVDAFNHVWDDFPEVDAIWAPCPVSFEYMIEMAIRFAAVDQMVIANQMAAIGQLYLYGNFVAGTTSDPRQRLVILCADE